MDLAEPLVLVPGLLIQGVGRAARFDDAGVMPWIVRLRHEKEIVFADPQQDIMLGRILAEARVAAVGAGRDAQARGDRRRAAALPDPADPAAELGPGSDRLLAELEFDYDGALRPGGPDHGRLAVSTELRPGHPPRRRRPRPRPTSCSSSWASARRRTSASSRGRWSCPPKRMAQVTARPGRAGWRVEAEGKLIRPAGEFKLAVTTRHRLVRARRPASTSAARSVRLPDLLAAAAPGRDDGRPGRRLDGDAPRGLAQEVRDPGRAGHAPRTATSGSAATQAGLLDALLAAQPEVRCRRGVRPRSASGSTRFEGVEPLDAPAGLPRRARGPTSARAWAGSTSSRSSASAAAWPTTWAWARRSRCWPCCSAAARDGRPRGPSLVVVPRSLVFNWNQEAARFTPAARACSTTPARTATPCATTSTTTTSILTTYGTLRSDIVELSRVRVRLRDPRRGAGDQERRQPGGQGGPAAPGPAPPGAERHADREPPGRALVPLRVPQPRHARRRPRSSSGTPAALGGRTTRPATLLAKAAAAVHPPPDQGAGRQGPAREDRADPLLRAGAGAAQALRRAARPLPPGAARARTPPS